MDSFVAAGDESAEGSQVATGSLALVPVISRSAVDFPAIYAAEEALTRAILDPTIGLSPSDQRLLLALAGEQWPAEVGAAAIPFAGENQAARDDLLAPFGRKLARYSLWCSKQDCDALAAAGLTPAEIIGVVTTVALGHFRCTLEAGLLGKSWRQSEKPQPSLESAPEWNETSGPFLSPNPPFSDSFQDARRALIDLFGFVPNLIQLQSWLPQIAAAETSLVEAVLAPEDHLSQIQKHGLLLSLGAANCNSYLVALHGEILNLMGTAPKQIEAILDDLDQAEIPVAEKLLHHELRKLALTPGARQHGPDLHALRSSGLSEAQIAEGIAVVAMANFFSTVQSGLGVVTDFPPLRNFHPKDLYLSPHKARPTENAIALLDPDRELVLRVKAGETEAFEELVRAHTRRVFRTLCGLLGDAEEARDATQDTFLKAFEHVGKFEGRAKFSTWLTSIAVNTGTEILRRRRPIERLDESEDEAAFRPRQVQSWIDDPEQAFAKAQLNDLVRNGVLRLPEKYRVALLLRDINQLSTEDTAAALGLSIPAAKARVLRGRLMLRESLTPHLSHAGGGHDD